MSSETRVWILSALTKISEGQTDLILDLAESLSSSQDTVLRQQAQELRHLSQDSQLHEWVLPRGAPWDGIEVTELIVSPYYDMLFLLKLHYVNFGALAG